MVMIGTDSHKRTHTVVAVDDVGRRWDVKTVRTNSEGHLELVRWAARGSAPQLTGSGVSRTLFELGRFAAGVGEQLVDDLPAAVDASQRQVVQERDGAPAAFFGHRRQGRVTGLVDGQDA